MEEIKSTKVEDLQSQNNGEANDDETDHNETNNGKQIIVHQLFEYF